MKHTSLAEETDLARFKALVARYFKIEVTAASVINAGGNNRLYRLDLEDGRVVVAKRYQMDDRDRLNREFKAITFLNQAGFRDVPLAYFSDPSEEMAVYSFAQGQTRPAHELTAAQLTAMADFLVRIHRYTPDDVREVLPTAILPCFSWDDYTRNIQHRLDHYNTAMSVSALPPQVAAAVAELQPEKLIPGLVDAALKGVSAAERARLLPKQHQRLSPIDFGPHNTLVGANGEMGFLDFEYFGWDDPLRVVADCVTHDQMQSLAPQLAGVIPDYYLSHSPLPPEVLERFPRVIRLMNIEWITVHLFALTPRKIAARRFADPRFDIDAYGTAQLQRLQRRINYMHQIAT